MANPLTPEPRVDKTGKTVTRWVKTLETGEPAIPIPAPQSPDQNRLSGELFSKMYVDINPDNGYLIDACGREVFYTYEFTEHALNLLPTATLRKLSKRLTHEAGSEQSYLMMPVFTYVDSMYERSDDADVDGLMETGLRGINNALVFHEPLGILEKTTGRGILRQPEDYVYLLNSSLEFYEGTRGQRSVSYEEHVTTVDYSTVSKEEREKAVGFVVSSILTNEFTEDHRRVPEPEMTEFVASRLKDLERIVEIAVQRGFKDPDLFKAILDNDVAALSDGVL